MTHSQKTIHFHSVFVFAVNTDRRTSQHKRDSDTPSMPNGSEPYTGRQFMTDSIIESPDFRRTTPLVDIIVYIKDIKATGMTDLALSTKIETRIKTVLRIEPIEVQCYSKLGIGHIRVSTEDEKGCLINMGNFELDPTIAASTIIFTDTFELVWFVVFEANNQDSGVDWPSVNDISSRWVEVFRGEKPCECEHGQRSIS